MAHRLRRVPSGPEQVDALTEHVLAIRHLLTTVDGRVQATEAEVLAARHHLGVDLGAQASSLTDLHGRVADLERQVARLTDQLVDERSARSRGEIEIGLALASLSEAVAHTSSGERAPGIGRSTKISVVMAVRDRADVVAEAVESVVAQTHDNWELLVVDDGSADDTAAVVRSVAPDDPRITVIDGDGTGVGAARNRALEAATGEVIAYLDSDNWWLPTYLEHVASAFAARPDARAAVAAQLVVDGSTGRWRVRDDRGPLRDLVHGNLFDLNAFAHRRALVEERGGFDVDLARFGDWDLVRRFLDAPPVRIPYVGAVYREGRGDQISRREPQAYYHYLVRQKHRPAPTGGPRVLVAEWHYPQLTESYVQAEIDGLVALGADVAVWAEDPDVPTASYPTSQVVHRGRLEEALARHRPDVVLTHWLHIGERYADQVGAFGAPLVVRGHGFDHSEEVLERLGRHPAVARVHLFPHFALSAPDAAAEVCHALPVAFDADRFHPGGEPDRSLVVRAGVALPTKGYDDFFEVARRCPDHRFVLCLVPAHTREDHLEEVLAARERSGAPVEIRVSVPRDEMAQLLRGAGTYLHTRGEGTPVGMPISIAEAMASGCRLLVRDDDASRGYLAEGGDTYTDVAGAATAIRASAEWDDERWREQRRRAVHRAYSLFTHIDVAEKMLDDWRALGLVR